MDIYNIVVFFIFGTVLGSFYNVVAYRLPHNMSLLYPPSHCTNCNHTLTPIELIPIISYLIQGGKCKNCKQKIALFYPVFEFTTGILFALTYIIFGLSIDTFIALVFLSMILIIILSDTMYMVILDSLLLFCGLVLFILELVKNGIFYFPNLIYDMIIPFSILFILKLIGNKVFKKESLGDGDIKLMLVFGIVLGWELSIFTIVLSAFIALPMSLISMYKNKDHMIPYGPYLGIAALICLFTRIDINTILSVFKV